MKEYVSDVVIIGAGPAGAIAGALLVQKGWSVHLVERQQFPRFSIGESLLPQCMEFIEQANMLEAVYAAGFQFKNGAVFERGGLYTTFDFNEKFTPGHSTTYQVERGKFDKLLADEAQKQGANIFYKHSIKQVDINTDGARLQAESDGQKVVFNSRFILDASGFGRVLPRLLGLDRSSHFPIRESVFTHIQDNISEPTFDRNKILISIHPQQQDLWYWLIPFSAGRASLGVVGERSQITAMGATPQKILHTAVAAEPTLAQTLAQANFDTQVQRITGYASNVSSLAGPGFALLGNAGEFLDPVFSSGVTIAMKSAQLASDCLHRQLKGEQVNWQREFSVPLKAGVDVFKAYVQAWYDGRLQQIIFYSTEKTEIKRMICSILAGYAWDTSNPYVTSAERRLNTLAEICSAV